ncbi:MAG: T9SS type A sorting domain-containing protein, partial [Moheibacter sp.]
VETVTMAPSSSTPFGTIFSFTAYRLVFDLATPIELSEGTYWLEPTMTNTDSSTAYWEMTLSGTSGAIVRLSGDSGENWSEDENGSRAIFYVAGECEEVQEGCLDAPMGRWPDEVITLGCTGSAELVTNQASTEDYSELVVTNGSEYIFTSSVATDYITIGNADGTEVLAHGTGPVTWTANFDGNIRFYLHLDENCSGDEAFRSKFVQCDGVYIIEEPDFDCFQGDGLNSNGFENGYNISQANFYRASDDFIVDSNIEFTLQQISLSVFTASDVNNTIFNIREDNGGVPGTIIETFTTSTPTEDHIVGTGFGMPVHYMVFDLTTPIVLNEGTYWLEPIMANTGGTSVYWELTSTGNNGANVQLSEDSGNTWAEDDYAQAVFFVSGECDELGLGDLSSFDFSYYPNPVQDELNLTSKKSIESVSVYNLAGQQVLVSSKVANGQLNVSTLPTGTYVFKVVLEGGQIETFKIIKK